MASSPAGVVALALAALPQALAFRNTSPFFLFSTADLHVDSSADFALSASLAASVQHALSDCPTRTTLLVRQQGVSSADYSGHHASRLASYLDGSNAAVKSSMTVSDVVRDMDTNSIAAFLQSHCGAELLTLHGDSVPARAHAQEPLVVQVDLPAPPPSNRAIALGQYDSLLETLIADYADSQDYTVIYTTSPQTKEQADETLQHQRTYHMESAFDDAVQMELKRDISPHAKRAGAQGGLFETYQFLSPGLFMGISAVIPLILILYVGLRAITSLEVSYYAFSKDMGPAAQKKQ